MALQVWFDHETKCYTMLCDISPYATVSNDEKTVSVLWRPEVCGDCGLLHPPNPVDAHLLVFDYEQGKSVGFQQCIRTRELPRGVQFGEAPADLPELPEGMKS